MDLCQICNSGCCRRYFPIVTGYDIINIVNSLKVDLDFFISASPVSEEQLDKFLGKFALFLFTDSGEPVYFRLGLKANESKYFKGTSKCMFLQEWSADAYGSKTLKGIIGRCGIYGIRPLNCRAWPASFKEETKSVQIRDPYLILEKEHVDVSQNEGSKLCPLPLQFEDYKNHIDDMVKNVQLNEAEKSYFMKLAEKWNQNPDVSDNFFEFLIKEYQNRIEHITE